MHAEIPLWVAVAKEKSPRDGMPSDSVYLDVLQDFDVLWYDEDTKEAVLMLQDGAEFPLKPGVKFRLLIEVIDDQPLDVGAIKVRPLEHEPQYEKITEMLRVPPRPRSLATTLEFLQREIIRLAGVPAALLGGKSGSAVIARKGKR